MHFIVKISSNEIVFNSLPIVNGRNVRSLCIWNHVYAITSKHVNKRWLKQFIHDESEFMNIVEQYNSWRRFVSSLDKVDGKFQNEYYFIMRRWARIRCLGVKYIINIVYNAMSNSSFTDINVLTKVLETNERRIELILKNKCSLNGLL